MGTLPRLDSFEITHFFDDKVDSSYKEVDFSDERVMFSKFFLVVRGGQGRSGRSLEVLGGVCSLKDVEF